MEINEIEIARSATDNAKYIDLEYQLTTTTSEKMAVNSGLHNPEANRR